MSLVTMLPFPPMPDESARGLVVRLAEDNLCSSSQMCEWLGIPKIDGDLVDPVPAAKVMGIDPGMLAAMGFADGDKEAFLGHRVPRLSALRHFMRVCTACLSEAPYHRRIWDHHQIDACPIHRAKLQDRCTGCTTTARTRWKRCHMLFADCGHDLSCQPVQGAGDCVGAAVVYRHCGLPCDGPDLPPAFSGLGMQDLLDLLFFLGRIDVVVARGNPGGLQPRSMRRAGSILDAGARIALGWPEAFDDLAVRVKAAYPDATGTGSQYGYLHRFIERCGDAPYARLLRDAYANHLAGRADVSAPAWPIFLERPFAATQTVSTLTARHLLGLGWKSFVSLRAQPLWTDLKPVLSGRNGTAQFRRDDVLALGAVLARLVSPYIADRQLGFGEGRVSQLIDAGLIPVHMWNRGAKNCEPRSLDSRDVAGLFADVARLCRPTAPTTPVPFRAVVKMVMSRSAVGFPELIRCLLEGTLRGHLRTGGQDFAGIVFEDAEVDEVLDRMGPPPPDAGISMSGFAGKLRIPATAVDQLIAAGLLDKPAPGETTRFGKLAAERFLSEFTLDRALARTKKYRPKRVREELARIGVSPVAIINIRREAECAVYRKVDLKGFAETGSAGRRLAKLHAMA